MGGWKGGKFGWMFWGAGAWACGGFGSPAWGWGAAGGVPFGLVDLKTSILHVGHVCCLWNQDLRQLVWKMWLHGSFLALECISSLHIIQTLSPAANSSSVAVGYLREWRSGWGSGNQSHQIVKIPTWCSCYGWLFLTLWHHLELSWTLWISKLND